MKAAIEKTILRENEPFEGVFLLKTLSEFRARNGNPYLALTLGTCDLEVEGRMWDTDMDQVSDVSPGDPVRVGGVAQLYQGRLQVKVDSLRREDGPVDPRTLYPASRTPEARLREQFEDAEAGLAAPELRSLFGQIKKDEGFTNSFFLSPAAVAMHHARIGGLAEHSLGACRIAQAVADLHPWLDRDILTAGCLLHDVGKVREYAIGHAFEVTLAGRLVGHIATGATMLESWAAGVRGFPERLLMELTHIVLSHHGQTEHGSPKAPATPEALVVHYADDLDAKLDMLLTAGAALTDTETGREAFVRGLKRSFVFFRDVSPGASAPENPSCAPSAKSAPGRAASDGEQGELL